MPEAIPGASSSTPPSSNKGSPLLRVVGNAELDEAELRQRAFDVEVGSRPVSRPADLGSFVRARWSIMRDHRNSGDNPINERLLRAQRMFEGRYDPRKLQEIRRFGGSEVYSRLVAVKCRGATSLLRDVYIGADRPWSIEPEASPVVPDEIKSHILQLVQVEMANGQMNGQPITPDQAEMRVFDLMRAAQQAAKRTAQDHAAVAADKLHQILEAGSFYNALAEFLVDLPLFPFAVLKGPVVRMVPKIVWDSGRPVPENRPQMFWERCDPFNFYWSPGASRISDAEIIERKRYTRTDLNDLLGLPGYDQEAVRAALNDYDRGLRDWLDSTDSEAAWNVGREDPSTNRSNMIDAIEYHGNVQGHMLLDEGVGRDQIPDPDRDYMVQTWVVGEHTLKTQLTPSPRQRHPYYVTSFEKVPGTILGHGLPDILEDWQEMANATLRSMVNNMCLTGDTVVYREPSTRATASGHHRGKTSPVTLLELWEGAQKPNPGTRRNVIRALDVDTGALIPQRIDVVHDNGVQDVFEIVTARGYRIRATATHRFLADDGDWRKVRIFQVGDLIGVNGAVVPLPRQCRDCGAPLSRNTATRCKSCAVKAPGSWNDRQAQAALHNRAALATTARMRKLVQAALKPACEPCHKVWPVRYGNFGNPYKHRFLDFDRIESIRHAGRERTFCLTMQGHPNFVANGFVSHNSIASGPQCVINTERLAPTENADALYPWKRWYVIDDPSGQNREPITFFQPQSNSQELVGVYNFITSTADDISAIPRYATGESLRGGAGRTASGLSMLMNNSSKILQTVASNVDIDVMDPCLTALYDMIMLTDRSGMLTGDEQIVVNGVTVALQKETERQKQLQFLQITANPLDAPVIGQLGRARVLRAVASSMGLPDDIVPSDSTLEQQMQTQKQQEKMQMMLGGPGGPGEGPGDGGPGQSEQGRAGPSPASQAQARQAQGMQPPEATPAAHRDVAPPFNAFRQTPNRGAGRYGP